MNCTIDRADVVDRLTEWVVAGRTVLLLGPIGIGKTTILRELARVLSKTERPVGVCHHTGSVGEVTAALARVYPEIGTRQRKQRTLRGALRLAIDRRPGALLLDHLVCAGTILKGFLRSLQGTGLSVVIAADIEHKGDHARVRALRVAFEEMAVPRLPPRHIREILLDQSRRLKWPSPLHQEDEESIVETAAGRPGWVVMMAERLCESRYWTDARVRTELLRADVNIAVGARYFRFMEPSTK